VPNLTQVTVDGSTNVDNYLRVTIAPEHGRPGPAAVLSWARVPYTG
jgi:hypothetical protein